MDDDLPPDLPADLDEAPDQDDQTIAMFGEPAAAPPAPAPPALASASSPAYQVLARK